MLGERPNLPLFYFRGRGGRYRTATPGVRENDFSHRIMAAIIASPASHALNREPSSYCPADIAIRPPVAMRITRISPIFAAVNTSPNQ